MSLIKVCLVFDIDDECEECKRDYWEIITSEGDMLPIPEHKVLVISPDYNSAGNLTHYHMDIIAKSKIKHTWVKK